MNQFHIKNHYVPECYLKRWENSEKKLFVYRTLVDHSNVPLWRLHSASAIAYQKHLYTQILSGRETDEIEWWFNREFESPANNVLDKVISERNLNAEDWKVLIKFLAAQDARTPSRLFEHLQRAPKEISEVLQETMNELQGKLERGEIDHIKNQKNSPKAENFPLRVTTYFEGNSDVGILKAESYAGRSTWIHSMKHVLENTRMILHTHKWTILKPAKGYFWPTSDNPVIKLNYYSPGHYDLKGGWGVKKGNIIFPLGPEHAMFVEIGEKPIKKNTRISENQTQQIIKFIVENSHRKIFSNFENKDIEKIRKRIVDPERLSKERLELNEWHKKNSELEKEYISSNRKA